MEYKTFRLESHPEDTAVPHNDLDNHGHTYTQFHDQALQSLYNVHPANVPEQSFF